MKYKINFKQPCGFWDCVIIDGETVEELRENADNFFKEIGLDAKQCESWSEEIKHIKQPTY